jgi:hypothetical protein
MTPIRPKVSLYMRKAEIRSEGLGHRSKLAPNPQKLVMLSLHMTRALIANWQRLIDLLVRPHIQRPLSYLLQVVHNVRTKQKLRVGSPGVNVNNCASENVASLTIPATNFLVAS